VQYSPIGLMILKAPIKIVKPRLKSIVPFALSELDFTTKPRLGCGKLSKNNPEPYDVIRFLTCLKGNFQPQLRRMRPYTVMTVIFYVE